MAITTNKKAFTDNLRQAGMALIELSAKVVAEPNSAQDDPELYAQDSVRVNLHDVTDIEFAKRVKFDKEV